MHWQDQALILSLRPHGESAAIATIFAREHGLYCGYVHGAYSRKHKGVYQVGHLVETRFSARSQTQLGRFQSEIVTPITSHFMQDKLRLHAVLAVMDLLCLCVPEREPHQRLFDQVIDFCRSLTQMHWFAEYVRLELALLRDLGFGLDLSLCAVTGAQEALAYVSPKSGRAVSYDAGAAYKDKLFLLPSFLTHIEPVVVKGEELKNGLAISEYFLNKCVLAPHHKAFPPSRERMIKLLITD